MTKLSEAQRKVLQRMADGETLRQSTGYGVDNTRYSLNWDQVNANTIRSLNAHGYIHIPARRLGQFLVECVLTDAGRAALKEAQP